MISPRDASPIATNRLNDGFRQPAMFILASGSAQRMLLLRRVGIVPDEVMAADIDETPLPKETPRHLASRLALKKAEMVAGLRPNALVLAADTVVARGRRILGKPKDRDEAEAMLDLLSGTAHRVHTGVCVMRQGRLVGSRLSVTRICFKRLHPYERDAYLDCCEWQGRAGGYALQASGERFVRRLVGSCSGASGLPLFETVALLEGAGMKAHQGERTDERRTS